MQVKVYICTLYIFAPLTCFRQGSAPRMHTHTVRFILMHMMVSTLTEGRKEGKAQWEPSQAIARFYVQYTAYCISHSAAGSCQLWGAPHGPRDPDSMRNSADRFVSTRASWSVDLDLIWLFTVCFVETSRVTTWIQIWDPNPVDPVSVHVWCVPVTTPSLSSHWVVTVPSRWLME